MRIVRAWRVAFATLIAIFIADSPGDVRAQSATLARHQQALRDLYRALIEIDTTRSSGDTTRAAEAMARRLLAAGFPSDDVQVLAPAPRRGNMVAQLRGNGSRRPILLLAHLDVVEARREDWSVDPFTLLERDGYFYGRGTSDDKAMAAISVANLIRYKQTGFIPLVQTRAADDEVAWSGGAAPRTACDRRPRDQDSTASRYRRSRTMRARNQRVER